MYDDAARKTFQNVSPLQMTSCPSPRRTKETVRKESVGYDSIDTFEAGDAGFGASLKLSKEHTLRLTNEQFLGNA